ncbi:N-6 DNA methylase [Nocardia sp. SC052]|uniref:restriction endonuclease subunit M n=1 Tax=Nocardia sichangensis TaxID=3385975 RepID=UPI00399FFFFA
MKKPEEMVRQEFIYRLHTQWKFPLEQMRQEVRTQRGRGATRADVVIAESVEAAKQNRDWRIVVETKAENIPIRADDYGQGESYARAVGAEFLVMHNSKETAYCRLIPGAPGERIEITRIPQAHELGDAKRLEEIRQSTKTFTRDEFQRLLFECHSILRDNHKMDPGAAFDEISKILFIKMAYERQGTSEIFTIDRLKQIAAVGLLKDDDPAILTQMFDNTKSFYRADQLFGKNESLKVSLATFKRIVSKLQKFNLSDTGDDVKGIAFERFLGQTFRGELGQFFTPRPLVDFMVEMLDPEEGEVVCDPASGTGGFLIRVFEHLRERLEREIQVEKAAASEQAEKDAEAEGWSDDQLVARLEEIQATYNRHLDVTDKEARLHKIAHNCIFGTDAEARAARTSKMNMIMHGDGHGGIHYHDGLLDVNGIFEENFNIVLTNPPFGANVGKDQIVGATEQTRVELDPDILRLYRRRYGRKWEAAHDRMVQAAEERRTILELFDIGRDPIAAPPESSKVRPNRPTEQLFIERCLNLLAKGGRMGIVLPDGILNNPSLAWLREYVEGRARLLAVVSVPQDVFASSKATVKTSLVFLQRFTEQQEQEWEAALETGRAEAASALVEQRQEVADMRRRAAIFDRDDLADLVDEISALEAATKRDPVAIRGLKTRLKESLLPGDQKRQKDLDRQALAAERELDRREAEMTRNRARELTSYPVFMAEAESAGITSTGETGLHVPNDLPEIVAAYRRFKNEKAGFAEEVSRSLSGAEQQTARAI